MFFFRYSQHMQKIKNTSVFLFLTNFLIFPIFPNESVAIVAYSVPFIIYFFYVTKYQIFCSKDQKVLFEPCTVFLFSFFLYSFISSIDIFEKDLDINNNYISFRTKIEFFRTCSLGSGAFLIATCLLKYEHK